MNKKFIVQSQHESMRLDVFLTEMTSYTRSKIKKEIKDKKILVNNNTVKSGYLLKSNDIIELYINDEIDEIIPSKIDFKIIYEDLHIIVISKPVGIVVHPGAGTKENTLVSGLIYYDRNISKVGEHDRPGIVHRLDKDTSGLMIIAKNEKSYDSLVSMFKNGEINKEYLAMLTGILENEVYVDEPIGRNTNDRKTFAVTYKNSKEAKSKFIPIKTINGNTLCRVIIETGRTHQIRVHARFIKHPVVGDSVYGYKNPYGINAQLLHAFKLTFKHPITGELLEFHDEFPERFENAIKKISRRNS